MSLGRDWLNETIYERQFAEEYADDETLWVTKEGSVLKIAEMETSHIQNCIKFMERNGTHVIRSGGGTDPSDFWYDEDPNPKYEYMLKVLRRRAAIK